MPEGPRSARTTPTGRGRPNPVCALFVFLREKKLAAISSLLPPNDRSVLCPSPSPFISAVPPLCDPSLLSCLTSGIRIPTWRRCPSPIRPCSGFSLPGPASALSLSVSASPSAPSGSTGHPNKVHTYLSPSPRSAICKNGTPKPGPGALGCGSCAKTYKLKGDRCVKCRPCSCPDGSPDTKIDPCKCDGGVRCVSCKKGFKDMSFLGTGAGRGEGGGSSS